MESLEELNKICQKPRYKETGNWMVRHCLRDAALPMTWLLLHTPVTANQVTLASLAIGLLGVTLLAFPGRGFLLAGALMLQFWYYLDHVDGQIARYRKTASLSGRFFDFLTHHTIHGTLFFGLGVCAFQWTGSLFFVVWGFAASISILLFSLCEDTKHKTFYEALTGGGAFEVLAKEEIPPAEKEAGGWRRWYSRLHKACEIHVAMNALTAAAVLAFPLWDFRLPIFLFYGLAAPFLAAAKAAYLIRGRRVDLDYAATFRRLR